MGNIIFYIMFALILAFKPNMTFESAILSLLIMGTILVLEDLREIKKSLRPKK